MALLGKSIAILGPFSEYLKSFIVGEMHFIQDLPDSWFNLPREGGVAYAAQESWVQNETIRENILFGSPFDEERYRKGTHAALYFFRSNASMQWSSNVPLKEISSSLTPVTKPRSARKV